MDGNLVCTDRGSGATVDAAEGVVAARAIAAVFFLEAAVFGNWIPRIPEIKAALGLSDTLLGLCLLAMPLGTFLGLALAGRVLERIALASACRRFLLLFALVFVAPPFAGSAPALALALFVAGIAVGLIEVAMNTEADRIEHRYARRIMSRCHGFWSLGSMAGALAGAALAEAGIAMTLHFALAMPLLGLVGWTVAARLPAATEGEGGAVTEGAAGEGGGPTFRLPSRALLPLCAMPLGIMLVEGAFIDWSAVFLRGVLEASPLAIGAVYAAFSTVMAATRLAGDRLAERAGDLAVVRVSGLAAAAGVGVFALAPNVAVAFAGAALAGMGVAIVYPLAISAAARRAGRSAADNVAALTMIAFSAFLVGPPLIGVLSDLVGLRAALAVLVPLALTTALLAGEVARAPRAAPVASR